MSGSYGEDQHRVRWTVLGSVSLAVVVLWWLVLKYVTWPPFVVQALDPMVLIQVVLVGGPVLWACVAAVIAPATPRRKALSFVWVVAYLLAEALAYVRNFGDFTTTSWALGIGTYVATLSIASIALGWWLTLRGRRPRCFWTLLLATVVLMAVGFVFMLFVGALLALPELEPTLLAPVLLRNLVQAGVLWGCARLAARMDGAITDGSPRRAVP